MRSPAVRERCSIGIEFDVPVEEVIPAVVQAVGREGAAVLLQIPDRRLRRVAARSDAGLDRQSPAPPPVARNAGGDDVLPCGSPAARARHDMPEGQIVRGKTFAPLMTGEPYGPKKD